MKQGKLILIPNLIGENNFQDSITKKIHLLEHKILPLSISQAGYILRNGLKGND